jgi:excisionase family DNA binding protein
MTVSQAAQVLDVRRQRIYALIAEGALPSVTEHRHVYIPAAAVRERLAQAELPGLMTVADVAAAFNTTTKTVYHWHQSGKLPGKLLSRRRLRFDPADVSRFARAHGTPQVKRLTVRPT